MAQSPAQLPRGSVWGRAWVPLVTPAESAALDAAARSERGIPERVLMETAGRAAALCLDRLFPRGRVVVAVGGGNNGGDGLVLARVLTAWGRPVTVVRAATREIDAGLLHGHSLDLLDIDEAAAALAAGDVLVDALLGTGARGAARGRIATAIEALNETGRPILALDLPSGVDAETGKVEGVAVRAEATVCFGWPKLGLMLHPARAHCGRLVSVEIGFPPLGPESARAILLTSDWAAARLPVRPASAHKGTAGRLLVVAGSEGMAGAAALTAGAARAAGAGLVRLASAASNRTILQVAVPEATFVDRAALSEEHGTVAHAVVVGPGLGQDEAAAAALARALELTAGKPALLDADALNLLAREPARLRSIAETRPVVITPHAKELERLTGTALDVVTADPAGSARSAAERFGCVVLLKGQPSVVATPDGRLWVNTVGSSDLAAGGMGDQLAGVIGAFLAAGLDAIDAAGAGLFYSGRAADIAAYGASLGPRDVTAHLRHAFRAPGPRRPPLGLPFVTFDQPARR